MSQRIHIQLSFTIRTFRVRRGDQPQLPVEDSKEIRFLAKIRIDKTDLAIKCIMSPPPLGSDREYTLVVAGWLSAQRADEIMRMRRTRTKSN